MNLTSLMAVAIGVSMGVLTGYLADRKNRGGPAWGIGGFLFWPVALPWILALPVKEQAVVYEDRGVMWFGVGALIFGAVAIAVVAALLV